MRSVGGDAGVERRVVTVLFCDLVGSTADAEGVDPEDVRSRLDVLHRMLARILVTHGGTVQKFAGDAAMAVFGAPVAHEDDAERAVRAGLAILDEASRLNTTDASMRLHLRIGINTGETVIDNATDPARGAAFVFGDVVNTAARIQSSADVDTVAVGEATFRATARVFDFTAREPFMAKGKSEPVPTWRVEGARARLGVDVVRDLSSPLVGRDSEAALLFEALDRCARNRVTQLVTLVGEPGVGKSRLVAELLAYVESRPELVAWRQGRCLPYGEGITYWALGEIVKAQAGIDDTDDAEVAAAKLRATLPATGDSELTLARLLPLIGIESGVSAAREESFRAWSAYFESVADTGPLVLVFEDIHWADDSLLAFIEYLAASPNSAPLLLVCTGRPELLDEHPGWGAGSVSAATLRLSPLTDDETAELVMALLDGVELPSNARLAILERAGGNPLYAEEFVRMLRDRGLLENDGRLGDNAAIPLPDGVHALIAARLDVTTAAQKELLQTAAVIGKVFGPDAVAALLGRPVDELQADLDVLVRKEFIRPQRRTIGAGDFDYSFWHVLIRDVAYSALPRAHRARLHAALLEWTEQTTADRLEDAAEILAHHAQEARSLALALHDDDLASTMSEAARRWNLLAGERAFGLDTQAAVRYFGAAFGLTPNSHPDRLLTTACYGSSLFDAGRLEDAVEVLEPLFTAVDADPYRMDDHRLVESILDLSNADRMLGRYNRLAEHDALLDRAHRLLPDGPAQTFLASVLASTALMVGTDEAIARAISQADATSEVAGRHGWSGRFSDVTASVGRAILGEKEAYEQLAPLADRARRSERPTFAAFSYGWQALADHHWQGSRTTLARLDEGLRYATERGLNLFRILGDHRLLERLQSGDFAGAQRDALELDSFDAHVTEGSGAPWLALEVGESPLGAETELRRVADDPDTPTAWRASCLLLLARGARARGDDSRAREDLGRIDIAALLGDRWMVEWIPMLGRLLLAMGDGDRLHDGLAHARQYTPLDMLNHATLAAQVAEVERRLVEAAGAYDQLSRDWAAHGYHLEAAYALAGKGRCLEASGDPSGPHITREAEGRFADMGALGLGRW